MKKYIKKNGIRILWDTDNIKDWFTPNAVYRLNFPSGHIYIGSAEILGTRVMSHVSNNKGSHNSLLYRALKKQKIVEVSLLKSFNTLMEARAYETQAINSTANLIWEGLNKPSNKRRAVNSTMLNLKFSI